MMGASMDVEASVRRDTLTFVTDGDRLNLNRT
jgi:hypothetical protein